MVDGIREHGIIFFLSLFGLIKKRYALGCVCHYLHEIPSFNFENLPKCTKFVF